MQLDDELVSYIHCGCYKRHFTTARQASPKQFKKEWINLHPDAYKADNVESMAPSAEKAKRFVTVQKLNANAQSSDRLILLERHCQWLKLASRNAELCIV